MRFTNFASGCVGKVFSALLCILLGVVLTLGSIVGGGYYVLTKKGMVGKVQEIANKQGKPIDIDEELLDLSLMEWGKKLLPLFSNFTSQKIGDIENAMGIDALSKNINNMTGISIEVIKQSTLADFGKTFSENMTVANASSKFGIEFPNLPVFEREEFMNSPLSTAFAQMDEFEIQDFIEVTSESSPILQELADLKIGEMSNPETGIDHRINALELGQVITIVEEGENKSNAVLIKLKDTKVGELGSAATNDKIMEMQLQEVIDIVDGESNAVLVELREVPIGELGNAQTDARIKNMKIEDLITIDSNSTNILQYFAANDITLAGTDEFGQPNGVDEAIKVMTLKDIMTLTDPSLPESTTTKFMWALRDCPIQTIPAEGENPEILGIEDTLKITPFSELIETSDSHIWQYLGEATIENIGQKVDDMKIADAIEITETSPPILRKMRMATGEEDPAMFGSEDIRINELNTKLEPLILDLQVDEIIPVVYDEENPEAPTNSEPILVALRHVKLSNLNDEIKNLTVAQVFRPSVYNQGVLALIDPDTPIDAISTQMALAVGTIRMQKLINSGAIDEGSFLVTNLEMQSSLRNNSVITLISNYTRLLNGDGDTLVLPQRRFLSEVTHTGVINQELIDQMITSGDFNDGDTLVLDQNMSMAGDLTSIFNIMFNGYDLNIQPNTTMRSINEITGKDQGGYIFITNQYYAPVLGGWEVQQGGTLTGIENLNAIQPDGIKPVDIIEIRTEVG